MNVIPLRPQAANEQPDGMDDWVTCWDAITTALRADWSGVPGLEEALITWKPQIKALWAITHEPAAFGQNVAVNIAPELAQQMPPAAMVALRDALQAGVDDTAAHMRAEWKRRRDKTLALLTIQTLRAATGWMPKPG